MGDTGTTDTGNFLKTPISNGATWLPNTIWMQRLARQYHEEYYYKLLERGRELEEPQILTIKKSESPTFEPPHPRLGLSD